MSASEIRLRCDNPSCRKLIDIDKCFQANGLKFCSRDCVYMKIRVVLNEVRSMLKLIR